MEMRKTKFNVGDYYFKNLISLHFILDKWLVSESNVFTTVCAENDRI